VLFPARLRDTLIRLAIAGLYRALWTDEILDECFRSIGAQRPDLDAERLARTRRLMNAAVVDALVTGYEPRISRIELPDPDDRHVVAAAVKGGATMIVTSNTKDFPRSVLEPLALVTIKPDVFLVQLLKRAPGAVIKVLKEQAAALKNPETTFEELLDSLGATGLRQFAEAARNRASDKAPSE
jgi:predicted nucleic acid-binding protein